MEQNLKGDVAPGPPPQGLVDSAKVSANEIIRKKRKQLIEILHKDLEPILDDLISQSIITKEEYEELDKSEEDSKKKSRQLLLLVQNKGEGACHQFLECLEITFPSSSLALQCSVPGFSSLKQKAEDQQEVEQDKTCPTKDLVVARKVCEKMMSTSDTYHLVFGESRAMSSEGVNEVESLDPSVSSGAGRKIEKPDIATKTSSSREGVVAVQSMTNVSSSVLARDIPGSGETGLGGDPSSKTATEGSLDSTTLSAKEMIHKGQKHLTEILQKNSGVVLDGLLSKSVITKEEKFTLGKVEDNSKKAIWELLVLIQEKGEATCRHFLECLEMACPGSNLSLRCSLHTAEPSSLTEGVAELQSKTAIPGSTPIGDIPCSVETKEDLLGEASSERPTEGFAGWEAMAANKTSSDFIQKARKKLTEALLQIPPELIFQVSDSHLLLTQDEYYSLSQMKNPKELIESLIDLVLRKRNPAHEQFLDCLENLRHVFPTLKPIASYLEDATELSSLREGVAELQSKTNEPNSMLAGDIPCSGETSLGREASSKTTTEGSTTLEVLAHDKNPSKLLHEARRKLTAALQQHPELISNSVKYQNFLTQDELLFLSHKDPKELVENLMVMVLEKGDSTTHQKFLEYLDKLRHILPSLRPISEYLEDAGESSSLQSTGDLVSFQSTGNIPKSKPVNDTPFSRKTEAESKQVSSPNISKKGLVDSEPISSLEEMKEDSKNKSPGMMGRWKAKAWGAYSSVMNYLDPEQKRKMGQILAKLELCRSKKITLQEVLEISEGNLKERTPLKLGDLPRHFLRKVLALNVTARSTSLGPKPEHNNKKLRKEEVGKKIVGSNFFSEERESVSMNPLDVLCAVLFSSDHFLQQQILLKMSMCQFALPLLLPPLETSHCTLMLWAMRDIVKLWRPHSLADSRGFREESLVLISMPTISFVRMGKSSFSKSKFVNQFLSSSHQHHNFFVHRDMKGGNIPREIANGLVEVSWYLPGEQKSSSLLPEAVALANLRGDFESHLVQFKFLTQVSSAVFIFAEHIGEREYSVLSSLTELSIQCYFIILKCNGNKFDETLHYLEQLSPVLNFNNSHVLIKSATINEAEFVEKLQSMIKSIISTTQCKRLSVQYMAVVARELKIQVDEDCKECQKAFEWAGEIAQDIKDVAVYKAKNLKLQSDLGKNLAKVEKELCRMKRHGDMPPENYRTKLKGQLVKLREQQYQCTLMPSFQNFINGIKHTQLAKKHYFLKWIKFNLDNIGRRNKLQANHKESSLGVEHFMRELGQFYEAEHSVIKNSRIGRSKPQYDDFPSIAADLMLEGFPLELIDGDASNIPLQWITDVLSKVHQKLRKWSRMFVITVLGVQSTGKSTLLNTMFGLQFAVSSGRCTRGAFMTLLKVRENLIPELGCDFILVIDTEGLKAPELAKLEDSYQHDNELATLVIGLSDITIVNMAMENAAEMKDILQIVTHAFLRMERIGQKPNCQFVHQNVSDVSAHDQNRKDRKLLLEQLDELTKSVAKMEKLDRDIKFSDIMDYDSEMHNWYIPSLWHGMPPMASVNVAYSEKVFELKQCLFEIIRSHKRAFRDIPQFIEWVKSLWNAVKHENFIFGFRNSLVAEAYTSLSMKYSEWDWAFRREMHFWVSEQETMIQNVPHDESDCQNWQHELHQKLLHEEQQILDYLSKYFESEAANLHLVEKYREDFVRSAKSLHRELYTSSSSKIQDAIRIKKAQEKIDALQDKYLKTIEGKVDGLLDQCRQRDHKLQGEELKREFDRMWGETLMEISPISLQQLKIDSEVEQHLTKELNSRGRLVNHKLETDGLLSYRIHSFRIKDVYISSPGQCLTKQKFAENDNLCSVKELVDSLIDKCRSYIDEKVSSKEDYNATYCSELLHVINEKLKEGDIQKLHTTPSFEVDLKLHILGEAAHLFQKMHDNFIKENDPRIRLDRLKSQYFSTFTDLYLEKDAQQSRAKDFCDQCLHSAFVDYVNKRLGVEIVDNLLASTQSIEYASRSFFQFTVLKELLDKKDFDQYVKYLKDYEKFVKRWILRQVLDHFSKNEGLKNLEKGIMTAIQKKVTETLKNLKHKYSEIWECLDNFCQEMQKYLVISKDSLRGIQFRNMSDPGQFFDYVENFLPDLEKQILSEFDDLSIKSKLSKLPVKPQDEIFKRVFGCGKQCPFCKVPCEAGGSDHKEHFAAVHRPQGLGTYRKTLSEKLVYSLCSTDVASEVKFRNSETNREWHPYKDYQVFYPDWCIQPDPSINASDYWKFVFKEFNHKFAACYKAKPADLPEDWENITKEQALEALNATYNMKQAPLP